MRSSTKVSARRWRLSAALFVVAMLVRLAPMGRYVTPDEPIWVLRAVRFGDAVAAGDWAAIPETGHPGVTTMALGALGVRLTAWLHPAEAEAHLTWIRQMAWLAPENGAAFTHLAYFLPAGRLLAALATSLALVGAYHLARLRLGERPARLLTLFLALDPFVAGHAGLLHTDALQATFALLALLFVLPRRADVADLSTRSEPGIGQIIGAALCLALTGLTKTLGLLIAPGVALVLAQGAGSRGQGARGRIVRGILRVGALAGLTILCYALLYPPAWRDPRSALAPLLDAASYHEGIGLRNVFFLGQLTPDPGPFFYPLVLLFRLTPAVLVGLGLALFQARGDVAELTTIPFEHLRKRMAWLALPALLFLAAITLPTKKFDRYALTAIPPLTAIAALAWAARPRRWQSAAVAALLLTWAVVAPLPLISADPLVGGPWLARRLVPLGWGEGSGLAAAQLSRLDIDTLAAKNVPGAAPFFAGETRAWAEDQLPCVDAFIGDEIPASVQAFAQPVARIRLAGLHLTTAYTQAIRLPPSLPRPWLSAAPIPGLEEVRVLPEDGDAAIRDQLASLLEDAPSFTWIHAPACDPLTEAQLRALLDPVVACRVAPINLPLAVVVCELTDPLPAADEYRARFGGGWDLLAAAPPATSQAPSALTLPLRWRPQSAQARLSYYVTLKAYNQIWAAGGGLLVNEHIWPTTAWPPGEVVDSEVYLPLPLHLPPGTYTLTLSLAEEAGGRLGLWHPDGRFGGTVFEIGEAPVAPPPYPAESLPDLPLALDVPAPGLRLIGADPPPREVWAGAELPFRLGWERVGDAAPPPRLRWALHCGEGVEDGGEVPLAPGDPRTWPPGHRYVTRYAPRIDPRVPAGDCALRVAPGDGPFVTVGEVTIRARERTFELPHAPQTPLSVTAGLPDAAPFATLVGIDAPATLTPGAAFTTTLYWRAQGSAPVDDYSVFVHVVGPAGATWTQSDAWPAQGSAPTSSWVVRQVIEDVHAMTLPADAPPGRYTIYVGLYDAESGGRVPLTGEGGARFEEDRAPVGTFAVRAE